VDSPSLRIGQVAEATGLPVKTVRFYCDEGLIQAVSRTKGGYRLFNPTVVAAGILEELWWHERVLRSWRISGELRMLSSRFP
jgi:predicted site-specific integrase-resolvase